MMITKISLTFIGLRQRSFLKNITVVKTNYTNTAWDQAMSYMYEHYGMNELCAEEEDYILFAYEHPKSSTALYSLINKTDDDLKVTLNMTQSISCVYCPSSGVVTKTVPANTLRYLCAESMDPDSKMCSYNYKTTVNRA